MRDHASLHAVKEHVFSYDGPNTDEFGDLPIFYGAYVGNNHYQLLEGNDPN